MRIKVTRTGTGVSAVSAAREENAGSIPGSRTAVVQAVFRSVEEVEPWL
jgi:hypothetical protein